MRKSSAIILACTMLIATGAVAALFTQPKVIFRKGPDTWVKIAKGNAKLAPFAHPHEIKVEEMARVLRSIQYFQPSSYSLTGKKGETAPLFEESAVAIIAEPLAKALGQAGTDEWVDFSLTLFHGPQLLGSFRQTDGVMFWKDDRLQIAFRNIAVKTEPGQTMNTYDPTRGYRAMTRLAEGDGRTLKAENWVTIDPAAVPVPAPAVAPGAQGAPPAAAPQKSARERLLELDQLKKDGLITDEEYQRKRKQILDEL